jgi:putative phage-type endonuclease
MANIIIKPKDRNEWLKYRQSGIGSSEVATILGLNPFETPYQLWRRKKGIDAPVEENFAMKRGHYLEDAVAQFYGDATGNEIIKASAGDWLIVNKAKEYMRVSPDRTFWLPNMTRNNKNKGIIECKTTQKEVDADNLPVHWFCQLQYQLGVAELEQGALAWLSLKRGEFGYKDITFDADFFAYEEEEVTRFWVDCILGNQEPIAMRVEDVLLKSPKHIIGKAIEADVEIIDAIAEIKETNKQIKEAESRKKELEDIIKLSMGDAEAMVTPTADILCTWKTSKDSEKFDEKRFAAEHPELYAQYQVTRPGSRRFNLK